jgi:hypothetical protein
VIRGEPSDAALDALLSELEGDARSFADKHRTELLSLPRDDRELWAELAAFLAVQRLRDRRDIMGTALGAVIRAAEEPQLRETVHDSLRRLTRRSARLTAAYSGLVLNLAGRVPDE